MLMSVPFDEELSLQGAKNDVAVDSEVAKAGTWQGKNVKIEFERPRRRMSSDMTWKNSPDPHDDYNGSLADEVTTVLDAISFLRSPLLPVH